MEFKDMMMSKMIPDDALDAVAGGAGTRPLPKYDIDDLVKVTSLAKGTTYGAQGRVTDREYDEALGEWTYALEKGYYLGPGDLWKCTGCSDIYYPESDLARSSRQDPREK